MSAGIQRASATDKREFGDSVRDLGSLPFAQRTMGESATSQRAAQSFQTRTRASSPGARSTRHSSPQTTQLGRLGATAFSRRVRSLAPSRCSACQGNSLAFAATRPAHRARTRNYTTGLRRAKQSGDRRCGGFEFGDGEKAFAWGFSKTRSHEPQPAHGADALNHSAQNETIIEETARPFWSKSSE